ncbi:5'-methylthioadenosine/S-adenosylhomocysteine nucleosidase [Actinomadura sp. HBU206391]|uniref:5'-methylthioadenosine/S-adenosylhomocysteine nucleosidase family protein n=1 Tax=Actinomadura sp. HBU206391 TaxID=2731692 RepID=UPI00164F2410|nr:5'-methylthioadenosine/S-adenosylhomocysteine nucleosidase [Actinomadura sp. HBU206391]MBC6456594.1 5'-methylthioadenosine/S-adenosylhomocysteine nucleosidase [Actinomadura sp. HBU206391]
MNEQPKVSGILNYGTSNVTSSAVGDRPVVNIASQGTGDEFTHDRQDGERWDVGVITILPVEAQAVLLALGLREVQAGGLRFYEGEVAAPGQPVKVVATRSLGQGQRSAMAAYDNLRRHYDPRVVVLAGIGGGTHPEVQLGDVVVATRVVYYDLRKLTPEGTRHRGEEREAPAEIGHAVNSFFTDHDPAEFPTEDPGGTSRLLCMRNGPIGSGEAVIADRDAETLEYLARFNDKILAVDMEAGGLSQACHEQSAGSGKLHGWAVIRGISDKAGADKNDDYHRIASWHAAVALRKLLPYLRVSSRVS